MRNRTTLVLFFRTGQARGYHIVMIIESVTLSWFLVLTTGGSGSSNSDRQSATSETKSDTGEWYSLLICMLLQIKIQILFSCLASSRCSVSKGRTSKSSRQKSSDRHGERSDRSAMGKLNKRSLRPLIDCLQGPVTWLPACGCQQIYWEIIFGDCSRRIAEST